MKIEAKIFVNSFFTQKCIQIAISIPNLHLVCFHLSFDVHIVHAGHEKWIFKNFPIQNQQIFNKKLGYFRAVSRQNNPT